MAKRKVQIEQLKEWPKLFEAGWSRKMVAEKYGICSRTVDYWIQRMKFAGVKLKLKSGPNPLEINAD